MTAPSFDRVPPPPPEPRLLDDVPRGPVLAFVPHPDDEIAGPGGALCLHRRAGDPVRVVIASDGRAGDPDGRFDAATYPELRRDESRRGLAELGVHDVEFWGFPDSCELSTFDLDLGVQRARASIASATPQVVYLPWEFEGHPDHHALHHVVTKALDQVGFRGTTMAYEIWNAMLPDAVLDITAVMATKRQAMACYASQLAYARFDHCVEGLNAYRSLCHGNGHGFYEAYKIRRY